MPLLTILWNANNTDWVCGSRPKPWFDSTALATNLKNNKAMTMNNHINTIDEVKDFFRYLVNDRKVNFHPDDNLFDYVSIETNKPTFCDYEARLFNEMMNDAFDTCEDEGEDIYEIANDIVAEYTYRHLPNEDKYNI